MVAEKGGMVKISEGRMEDATFFVKVIDKPQHKCSSLFSSSMKGIFIINVHNCNVDLYFVQYSALST